MPTTPRSLRRVRSGITSPDIAGIFGEVLPRLLHPEHPHQPHPQPHHETHRHSPNQEPEFRLLFNRAANAAVLVLSQSRGGPDENDPRNPGDPPDEISRYRVGIKSL